MGEHFIWLSLFVLISFTTQAMSGFGSVIIAVTFGANFYPIDFLLPLIVPLDTILNSYIVVKNRNMVDRSLLFKQILPYMGVGLVTGVIVFLFVQVKQLKTIFGFFIIILCVRELFHLIFRRSAKTKIHGYMSTLYIFAAGVVQGMFASGGPLLVYAVNQLKLEKSAFRSTLCAVWFACNSFLTLFYIASGRYNSERLKLYTALVPMMLVGLFIGDKLHNYIDDYLFKISVFTLLLFAGFSISFGSI